MKSGTSISPTFLGFSVRRPGTSKLRMMWVNVETVTVVTDRVGVNGFNPPHFLASCRRDGGWTSSRWRRLCRRSWKVWSRSIGCLAYVSANFPRCTSRGLLHIQNHQLPLLTAFLFQTSVPASPSWKKRRSRISRSCWRLNTVRLMHVVCVSL